MMIPMKRRLVALVTAGAVSLTAGCQDFLDVNTNPNAPERVGANLYLPPLLHWMATTQQWDGRCTSQYTKMLTQSGFSTLLRSVSRNARHSPFSRHSYTFVRNGP